MVIGDLKYFQMEEVEVVQEIEDFGMNEVEVLEVMVMHGGVHGLGIGVLHGMVEGEGEVMYRIQDLVIKRRICFGLKKKIMNGVLI